MAAVIKLTVKSDFKAASDDLKKFGDITEAQRKKLEKFQKEFKDDKIKNFNSRLARSTAAVKASRGPLAAMRHEHRTLQREIEKLIRKGLDPAGKKIKGLAKQYQKLEKEINDVTKAQVKSQKSMKRTEGAMLAIGASAIYMGKRAVDAIVDFSREAAQAASDAEEIEGKFNVVFRDIGTEASAAAKTIATDFDLAASTVNKLLGDTGDILTGLGFDQKTALEMSESVGTLALDLASFTNFAGGAEGASAALTKALLGEAESAKALGIVIRQDTAEYKQLVKGIMEVEQVGLTQAKALVALRIATEQSQNAIGDYARTAESTANVQRTLNEQIKRSKELWGEALNEGLTPLRTAYRDFLKDINDARESEKNITDALFGEEADIAQAVSDLKELEKTQQALFDAQATGAGDDYARVQLRQTQKRLVQLEKELEIYNRREAAIKRNKLTLDAEAEAIRVAAEEGEKRKNLSIAAFAEIEKKRFSALTAEEKQLELIDKAIDKWSEYKDIAGAQELLNVLIAERNELLKEEEIVNTDATDAAVRRISDQIMFEEALADRERRRFEESAEAQLKQNESMEEYNRLLQETKISAMDLAEVGLGAMLRGFEEVGKAIVENGLSFQTFGKLALTAVAEVLSALGAKLAAMAAVELVALNFAGAAIAGAGSAAAFTASGAVKAASAAFAEGGSFVTQGPMPIMVGDNIGGQERVTVEPVSSTGQNVENSRSESTGGGFGILQIGEEQFDAYMQKKFDNGGYRIPQRIVS